MDNKKIGAFIAKNRKLKGLTQEQLGEKLGVTNKTVSRWENGHYMPDLSLLEPLSRELGISLNELLAGEAIEKEQTIAYSEENLIRAIDYGAEEIENERKKISIFLMAAGILLCIRAFTVSLPESNWGFIYSVAGLFLFVAGLFRELKIPSVRKRFGVCAGLFLVILSGFLFVDYLGVKISKRPPIYRYMTETNALGMIIYHNPFYDVYQMNADTPNEYWIIDAEKDYSAETVPISPFNREKSGIDHILQYKNQYLGNNSNTGGLLGNLPLSEYGYVFEIDSEDCGLTVNYHVTDWYGNEALYVEKSLVYNSVSIFALIENVQYINYNFSGSTYSITREELEKNYPDYERIVQEETVSKRNFNKYVEQRMNDDSFIQAIIGVFHIQDSVGI